MWRERGRRGRDGERETLTPETHGWVAPAHTPTRASDPACNEVQVRAPDLNQATVLPSSGQRLTSEQLARARLGTGGAERGGACQGHPGEWLALWAHNPLSQAALFWQHWGQEGGSTETEAAEAAEVTASPEQPDMEKPGSLPSPWPNQTVPTDILHPPLAL